MFGRLVYKYRNMDLLRCCAVMFEVQNGKQNGDFADALDLVIWGLC